MIRPLSPLRPAAARPGAVDVNVTLSMNDGSLWRPRVSDGRLVFAGQSKPVRPAAGAEIRVAPPAGLRVLDEIDPWPGPKAAAAPPRPPPPPKAEPPDELW